jgi:hypothetical protein
MNWGHKINWLFSIGYLEKDEVIFLFDCLREDLPKCFECFGRYNADISRCKSGRWLKNYRICRICERISGKLKN